MFPTQHPSSFITLSIFIYHLQSVPKPSSFSGNILPVATWCCSCLLIHLLSLCCGIDTFDLGHLHTSFIVIFSIYQCSSMMRFLCLAEFLKNKECIIHAIFWIITFRSSYSWPEKDKHIPEFLFVVFAMKKIRGFIPAVPCLLGNTLFNSPNRCSIVCSILV